MLLLTFAQWCQESGLGLAVRDSQWLFPSIEAVHVLAMGLLGGAVLVVDLRLLGLGVYAHEVSKLEKVVRPWMNGGLVLAALSGAALWASQAPGYNANPPFRLKMTVLVSAIVFSLAAKPQLIAHARCSSAGQRATAALSLILWTAVGVIGMAIGFL